MGTRADFYIDDLGDMTWIASIYRNGQPWNIPLELLAQVNQVMFTEELYWFLEKVKDNYASNRTWPWHWEDSRMTDFSYILDCEKGKVVGYSAKDKMIFDPIKVGAGEDLNSAKIANAIPNFPRLGVKHGSKSSKPL